MRYNKFIFLYTSNFCERINDFYCIDQWVANGYDVEYWDLSAFTCHERLAEYTVDGLKVRKVENLVTFRMLVKEYIKFDTLYLTWVNYCWYSAGFYHILSENKCHYAFFDNSIIPILYTKHGNSSFSTKKIIKGLKNRYYEFITKKVRLSPAKYYFQLSEEYVGIDKMDANTIHGWCNSGDYERNQNLGHFKAGKYIVFLDQYIPYHNDNLLNGYKLVEPKKYYSSMNRCFSIVEKKYGMPVIIAAHPAAQRYNDDNPFEGREVVFNKTAELVKGSDFVIAHFTTAVSYVVLNEKKMMLFTSNAIKEARPCINDYIISLAELLGLKCINQDSATENDMTVNRICKDKYKEYKYRYLTNIHSESCSNYKNIIDLIGR